MEIMKQSFDTVICIMSGTTVQRGECAIADKYIRAEAAVREGADIVLELPYPYSSLGARDFAASGVHIATMLGIPTLVFGAENDGLEELVRLLIKPSTQDEIRIMLNEKGSLSYPQARQEYVRQLLGSDKAELLIKPNNILGIEYMIAGGDKISYFPIKRNHEFLSASVIRAMSREEMLSELPLYSAEQFGNAEMRAMKNLELAIIAKLRMMEIKDYLRIYDMTDDFAVRIKKAAVKATNLEELYKSASALTDTHAKIRRAVLHSFIGADMRMAKRLPRYTMLLAANRVKLNILNELNTQAMPVLAKPAHYKKLPLIAQKQFLLSERADDIMALADKTPKQGGQACIKSPVII